MENFIVSARKYRPVTFDTVVGQKSITGTLKNAIHNKQLAQAFLFCGPRGVGKTTCARILAKTINCMNMTDAVEPCNQCESCLSFSASASFNIHELDAASNNSVEDIRNLVDQVRVPPQVGKYKVYIIDEVHMLSQAAFNAFLKTLEEPPSYAKFILATTEKHKIIPTILSRCQIYDFKRITVNDIAGHLNFVANQEGISADPDALQIIAQKSDGALRDALSIFDQIVSFSGGGITYKTVIENLNVLDYDYYFRIADSIMNADYRQTLLLINEIIENGFDGQHFIIGFGEHLRNLLITKDMETIRLLEVSANIQSLYVKQTGRCTVTFLLNALDILNKCDAGYKNSGNKRLTLELALLQMCSLQVSGPAEIPAATKKTVQENPPAPYGTPAPKKTATGYGPERSENGMVAAGKEGIKTFSIKSPAPAKDSSVSPPENHETSSITEDFEQPSLEEAWNRYSRNFEHDKSFYSMLTKRKPAKGENSTISFTVDNKIQESELFARRGDLQGFLRRELNNSAIIVQVSVSENPVAEKPYVPHEKFNFLAEKNPHLRTMKEKFGLEPEY